MDEGRKIDRKRKRYGKRCAAMHCNKTNADDVSLHQFPSDDKLRKKWNTFVLQDRDEKYWTPGSGYVCSEHFTASDFENYFEKSMGFASKLILKEDAYPTIHASPREHTPKKTRTAQTKLNAQRVRKT